MTRARWGSRKALAPGLFPTLALLALWGCAPHLAGPAWVPPPTPPPYGVVARILFQSGGRAASFRAGCAVDPSEGGRMEVRDPLGSARLLLILLPSRPSRILLLDPARKLSAHWDDGAEGLPWVPEALWFAFTGQRPEGASLTTGSEGRLNLRWTTPGMRLKGVVFPSPQGPAPFSSVEIRGRGARIEIKLSEGEPRALPDGALVVADPDSYRRVDLWEILPGGTP